jgi:hypothetical protein
MPGQGHFGKLADGGVLVIFRFHGVGGWFQNGSDEMMMGER